MDDLISRQAAIDGLSKLRPRMIDTYEKDGDTFLKVRAYDVNDMLEGLPSAQPEPQWIPCERELPEEYGEYQITWITSASKNKRFIGICECEITSVWDEDHGRFKVEWLLDDYIKAYPDVKVLAWKPLDEPWRGEEP